MSQTPEPTDREKSADPTTTTGPIPVEPARKAAAMAPPSQLSGSPEKNAAPASPALGAVGAPSKARELVQAIASDFYNVTDPEGKPVAGLLVLLDGKRRPVRAELHLGGSVTDESGRQAVREAQHILETRYAGPDSLPLQVWQSFLRSEPLHVPLPPAARSLFGAGAASPAANAQGSTLSSLPWRPILVGAGALLIVALLWWTISALRGSPDEATAPATGGLIVPVDGASGSTNLTGGLAQAGAGAVIEGNVPASSAALPASRFAPADIVPGRRVRMVPGFTQTVLSEPSAGTALGEITPDTAIMVVGGPEERQGAADTIVWVQVALGEGVTGWVAANDSQKALLELAD